MYRKNDFTLELLEPADGAAVSVSPTLRWAAFPGAARYQVWVIDSDAYPPQVIVDQTTTDTSLVVSAPLQSGKGYSLTIRALDANGVTLAESNSGFTVTP